VEILLLHPGGLGDIILALPAVALLRERFPDAKITIAGNLDHLAPIAGVYVDNAISLSALPLHNLYADKELPQQDVLFWKSFDRIVSWTGSGDPGFVRKITEANPNTRVASWRPDPQEKRHVSQLFIDSLGPAISAGQNAHSVPIRMHSELASQGVQWLSEHGWDGTELLVALHPGAGSKTKRWPLQQFIELARGLRKDGSTKLLVIEGPAESGLARAIAGGLPAVLAVAVIRAESLPLNLLAAVMVKCRLFIGNDSGISHLAASLGIPVVVLFGPTLPRHWAPLGPKVTVLRDSGGCRACSLDGDAHTCLENLALRRVVQAIRDSKIEI